MKRFYEKRGCVVGVDRGCRCGGEEGNNFLSEGGKSGRPARPNKAVGPGCCTYRHVTRAFSRASIRDGGTPLRSEWAHQP